MRGHMQYNHYYLLQFYWRMQPELLLATILLETCTFRVHVYLVQLINNKFFLSNIKKIDL